MTNPVFTLAGCALKIERQLQGYFAYPIWSAQYGSRVLVGRGDRLTVLGLLDIADAAKKLGYRARVLGQHSVEVSAS